MNVRETCKIVVCVFWLKKLNHTLVKSIIMTEKRSIEMLCSPLPQEVQEKVFGAPSTSTDESNEKFIKSYISSLLPQGDEKKIDVEMKKRLLLAKHRLKGHHRQSRHKKTHLSVGERKTLGLHKLKKKGMLYQDFLALHYLWLQYFSTYIDLKFLKDSGFTAEPTDKHWEHVSRLLMKADYHGSLLTVTRSRCPSLVGKKGLVVLETKNTFQLITCENRLVTLPKVNSEFTLKIHPFSFTIYGKHFCHRPSERSSKKIKMYLVPDL